MANKTLTRAFVPWLAIITMRKLVTPRLPSKAEERPVAPALDANCRLETGHTKTWIISHVKLNCRNLIEIILNLV